MKLQRWMTVLGTSLLLWGCAAAPPMAGTPEARAAAGAEQKRLAVLLHGTSAAVSVRNDGSVRIAVPIAQAFDGGRAVVKPALARVLERLAIDQRDEPTRLQITAPTDPASRRLALGTDRAVNARTYLEERGVAAQRCSIAAVAHGRLLEILLSRG